ncbi:MAG: ABC transporter permease [Saccharofermentanales bacterium]|jgi:spermidine/putrescine transport system permease protein|nr:ABC transporter permease [Clostridiaceae bacterium]
MIARLGKNIYMILIFLFLYAPVAVLIVFSFNKTRSRAVWGGFTLEWYRKLFQNVDILRALQVTLIVAVVSALVSTVIATITCIGLNSLNRRLRSLIMNVTYIPNITPDLVTGVSLMLLFYFIGLKTGFATLLLAHIAFNIPYAILSISPKFRQLDRNLFEAALDLGCKPRQAIIRVILPEIMPGIVTALILTFTLSIDDFVISYFTAGNQVSTLAITIYSMARKSVNPQINALSTLMFLTVLVLLLLVNIRTTRDLRDKQNQGDLRK